MYTYFAGVKTIEELRQKYRELLKKYHPDNEGGSVEIIGSWIWVHSGYEYRELLKSAGFKFAPKKKCWCWHYGDYVRYHDKKIMLDEIRQKYGSKKVGSKLKQYAIS